MTLLIGSILAYRVRNVEDSFNESGALAQSIYVTLLLSVLCCLVGYLIVDTPNVVLIVYAVGVLGSLTFTLAALFLPKLIPVLNGEPPKRYVAM